MKQIILIGAVFVAVTAAFIYIPRANVAPQTVLVSSPTSASTTVQSLVSTSTRPATRTPATASATTSRAVLKAGDASYAIDVTPSKTVIDAMRALASAGAFAFTGRDYPGLGFFVDSINGEKNANGLYWMLYVNGVSASAGASTVVVHANDVVEWRYEKGF